MQYPKLEEVFNEFKYLFLKNSKLYSVLFVSLFTIFAVVGFEANFFVVLLEGSHVLTGLAELALFHALADVPKSIILVNTNFRLKKFQKRS